MRNRIVAVLIVVFAAVAFLSSIAAGQAGKAAATAGWTTLFDGKNLGAFNMVGDGLRDALDPRLRGTL